MMAKEGSRQGSPGPQLTDTLKEVTQVNDGKSITEMTDIPAPIVIDNLANTTESEVANFAESSLSEDTKPSVSNALPSGSQKKPKDDDEFNIAEELAAATSRKRTIDEEYLKICKNLGIVPASYYLKHINDSQLSLKHHGLGPKGAKAIAESLRLNRSLTILDLAGNWIDQDGGLAMADVISDNVSIIYLNLADNHMGGVGINAIAQALVNNSTLRTLILRGNNIGDKEAVALANTFRTNSKVNNLDLSHNSIGDMGALALANSLTINDGLRELNLSWNKIRSKGATAIINSLKENSFIQTLNLAWNGLKDAGATAVGQMFSKNNSLKILNISNNRIGNTGATALAKGIEQNDTIIELDLGGNEFEGPALVSILKSFIECSSLQKVHLLNCKEMSEDAKAQVNELKSSKPDFQLLLLDELMVSIASQSPQQETP